MGLSYLIGKLSLVRADGTGEPSLAMLCTADPRTLANYPAKIGTMEPPGVIPTSPNIPSSK